MTADLRKQSWTALDAPAKTNNSNKFGTFCTFFLCFAVSTPEERADLENLTMTVLKTQAGEKLNDYLANHPGVSVPPGQSKSYAACVHYLASSSTSS